MKTISEIITNNDSNDSYWFINIFYAIGGILSAIFLLLLTYVSFTDILNSNSAMMLIGIIFIAFSYFTSSKENTNFAKYFILTFTLTGGAILVTALLLKLNLENHNNGLLIMLVYSILFFLISSSIHRFISAFLILSSGYYFCIYFNIVFLYTSILFLRLTWFWLYEYKDSKYTHHKQIFAYALVIFILFVTSNNGIIIEKTLMITKSTFGFVIPNYLSIFTYYTMGLLTIFVFCVKYKFKVNISIFILIGAFLFYFTQPTGISIAEPFIVILLAFFRKNKILMTFGILGMLNNLWTYYYISNIDFLSKSKLLLIFALVILILTSVLHIYIKKLKREEYA